MVEADPIVRVVQTPDPQNEQVEELLDFISRTRKSSH
jgi:hypothetical protein